MTSFKQVVGKTERGLLLFLFCKDNGYNRQIEQRYAQGYEGKKFSSLK